MSASYAFVKDGAVHVRDGQQHHPSTPYLAWSDWLRCATSPSPILQQQARELRSALDEIGYLK